MMWTLRCFAPASTASCWDISSYYEHLFLLLLV